VFKFSIKGCHFFLHGLKKRTATGIYISNIMKTIGLIGGMSWESSKVYYELLNQLTKEKLGGFHSSKCIMYSVDFAEIEALQANENWSALDTLMADAAKKLELAGAEFVILCTNTMHLCSDAIVSHINVPFLHIAEATGEAIVSKNFRKVALLGTRFTMEKDFYKSVLSEQFGIEVLVPSSDDMQTIHDIIYQELVQGNIQISSREKVVEIINSLEEKGAQGVILGCTELPLLISVKDVAISVFDTTKIHAEKAVSWAMGD